MKMYCLRTEEYSGKPQTETSYTHYWGSKRTRVTQYSRFALYLALTILTVLFATPGNSLAITIGGENYEKILTVRSNDDFGYWTSMDKFYTFIDNDNYIRPIRVSSVDFRDNSLAGVSFQQVYAMGTVDGTFGPVNSGIVALYGASNELLLRANFTADGSASPVFAGGYAGQIDVDGFYAATGGSLFTSGLVEEQLYIEIAFDYVWKNSYADLKASVGTFTIYQRTPGQEQPPTGEVPEPMTMGLLLSGLVGAATKRKRTGK